MKRLLARVAALLVLLPLAATAQGLLGPVTAQDNFLPPDEAFRLQAYADGGELLRLDWQVAEGYYLYRHRVAVKTTTPGITLGPVLLPDGKKKTDEFFGDVEVYYNELRATVALERAAGADQLELQVTYQGCADAGLCYPPTTKTYAIDLPPPGTPAALGEPTPGAMVAEQDRLASLISSGNLLGVLATFFGLGLLLAFTPCVLPMIPILSGIIAGQGPGVTSRRAFGLSLAYVMGMAVTYTAAGAAFAAAGQQAQAFFQQPWMIIGFALLFVVLALAMFGLFELRIPAALEARLARLSGQQRQGSYAGTVMIGALSALIVSACVAPPLVATLAVIGQTGDVLRGALALFAMSLGMGAPLLLVGVAGGRLLPKAGPWMETIKALFGVMFLGVAVWMLERVLPGPVILGLWALLAFAGGYYLGGFGMPRDRVSGGQRLARAAGLFGMAYGLLMLVGAASGGSDPLQPLRGVTLFSGSGPSVTAELPFRKVASVTDLDRELAAAQQAGQPVMLDFYADWCVSCKEMDKYTFSDPKVQQALAGFVLLKADVTANGPADQALLKRFGIFGPPTTAFFGSHGRECRNFRLVGFVEADKFGQHLARFGQEC